ncbi:MAG: penicillin acylase family protein [Polyangiaceae bacterium]|nr:penicillin acylase family protein [Polyangiaceae bacterium]
MSYATRSSMRALGLLIGTLAVTAACGDDTEDLGGGGSGGGTGGTGNAGGSGGGGGGSEGLSIPGLDGEVTAVYDEHGILHLTCASDDDCYAALGYFHAQNRFFFMDFVRNLVRGKLGGLVKAGNVVLDRDHENRRFFTTPQGEPLEDAMYASASEEVKGYFDAYGRGVNAWIDDMRAGENGASLTTEYDFSLIVKENIRTWEPADSAAVGLYVLNDLSNNSASEITMAAALPSFDPTLAPDFFSARPVFDAFTQPAGETPGGAAAPSPTAGGAPFASGSTAALLADARNRLSLVGSGAGFTHPQETGSNNWVVGPDRTTGGNALLANDPHLLLTNPSIWFPVELDAVSSGDGVYHVAGSTFPGLPSIMVGHNEKIGWGVTTAYYDLTDVYVEQLSADGNSVIFNGNEVAIVEREFSFEDSSTGETTTQTFRYVPHHGPIVSEDPDAGTAVTIRWRGHDAGTDMDAFFAVARADSVESAREGIELVSSANQNFVVIDVDGNIGWYPYAKVPQRPWASAELAPWLPLPGTGEAEWGDPVAIADMPQLTNPPAGAIATANQDLSGASADGNMLNDNEPALQAFSKAEGTREQRILDLIAEGGNGHSVETMTAIQGDDFSLYGEFVVPAILAAAEGATLTAEEQDVIDALAAWNYTCPTGLDGSDPVAAGDDPDATTAAESIGCTAFHASLFAIVNAALGDEIAAADVDLDGERWDLHLVARALRDPSSIASGDLFWDDVSTAGTVETRDVTLLRGVTLAAQGLAAIGEPNAWRWGRIHTLTLRSIYDNFGVASYNDGPHAAPGALYTVNVANPRNRATPDEGDPWNFAFSAGPSLRLVIEATPEGPRMVYQLPGGADLHRESDFYNNLLPNWLVNEPIEFVFGPGAVTEPAVELTVKPAG